MTGLHPVIVCSTLDRLLGGPPAICSFELLVTRAVELPVKRFFDGKNAEAAMLRGTTTWAAAVDQGDAFDSVFIVRIASQHTYAWMKRTVFEKIADLNLPNGFDELGHLSSADRLRSATREARWL